MTEIKGFELSENNDNTNYANTGKCKKTGGGGFQGMGLSTEVLKGITKRGYKIPTPIQRKTIPLILEGRDVVAMAKTGSGKTACFLIPLFEKLKCRDITGCGARALIMSPTRELAIQTLKFFKLIGKFLNLKVALVLGGDPMSAQFSALHTNPDVIIATPGRFVHLCVEMDLKLTSIQYVVFDEADRLFEMGFGEQLNETLNRLPEAKQMLLFSATLPKLLVNFAKAGLSDPVLIRLDVETKLPEELELKFIYCRPDERYSALVALIKYVIPNDAQTIVFAATQHHVELISNLLNEANISNTLIYSNMDPSARKINAAKFQFRKVSVLIVTDIAARGIDIPNLDYVINLHFPGKPKLFVHRVGRCARAGRQGTAYSIFSSDDEAHLLDLHLFLNRPFNMQNRESIGIVPQDTLENEHEKIMEWLANKHSGIYRISKNAYKKYMNTRPSASVDSNKRVKNMQFTALTTINDFLSNAEDKKEDILKDELINKMRKYRPAGTIFELNAAQKSIPYLMMKEKRAVHGKIIEKFQNHFKEIDEMNADKFESKLPESTESDIKTTFDKIVTSQRKRFKEDISNGKNSKLRKLNKNYVPYEATDKHTEDGFAINSFEQQAHAAEFTIMNRDDNQNDIKFKPGQKKWDRLRKKMVAVQDPRSGKIRTESGVWIAATYKTGRYNEWKEKTKIEEQVQHDFADQFSDPTKSRKHQQNTRWARHNARYSEKQQQTLANKKIVGKNSINRNELKSADQIVKQRMRLELIKKKQLENKIRKDVNRKKHMKMQKRKQKRRT